MSNGWRPLQVPQQPARETLANATEARVTPRRLARRPLLNRRQKVHPILSQARHEEILPYCLSRVPAKAIAQLRILQDLHDSFRGFVNAVNQKPILTILDLLPDAADVATYDCGAFPHRFSDGQAKAFADGLLQHDVSSALEGVYESRIVGSENDDALVDGTVDRLEYDLTLRIVQCIVADQHERAIHFFARFAEGLDHAHRILPTIEARDLYHQRPIGGDAIMR